MNGASPVSYLKEKRKDLFLSERKNKEKKSKISNLKLENSFQNINSFDPILINKPITPKITESSKLNFTNLAFLNEMSMGKKDKKLIKSNASLIQTNSGSTSLQMMSKCNKSFKFVLKLFSKIVILLN
jgi:hypothetical protein